MRSALLVVTVLVAGTALVVAPTPLAPTQAAGATSTNGAYLNASSTGQVRTDWMAGLSGGLTLSRLTLPGTHDTGASVFGAGPTEVQSMTPAEQLKAGIRAFDVRLGAAPALAGVNPVCPEPTLWVFHGAICQFRTFDDFVLKPAKAFLQAHPGETLVMKIQRDAGSSDKFFERVKAAFDAYPGLRYTGGSNNPTLTDMRGKVVVLQNFPGAPSLGIDWATQVNPNTQDDYKIGTNWDLATKWNKIRTHFDATDNGDLNKIHANYLSAAVGSFPYFVASGKSSWETDAPRLWTGWVTGPSCNNNSKCIPEYPRVRCLVKLCSVDFIGTNEMSMNYLNRSITRRAGIVFADFPGQGLIDSTIALNPCPCEQPRGDNFDKRLDLASALPLSRYFGFGAIGGDNTYATSQAGEVLPAGASRSMWYSHRAEVNGRLVVDTCGSTLDTVLEAFTGSNFGSLQPQATSDNGCGSQSKITFNVTEGVEYQFRVTSKTVGGSFTLNWKMHPANDNFADAQAITGTAGSLELLNKGASLESLEPKPAGASGGYTTWYRYTAPISGDLSIDTCTSTMPTYLAVYTGSAVGALAQQASNDNSCGSQSAVAIPVVAGTTYRIQVDSQNYFLPTFGTVALRWSLDLNDDFAQPRVLTGDQGKVFASNFAASTELGEPDILGITGGHSLWYSYTAPHDGYMEWNTCGSGVDTLLAMYIGDTLQTLESYGQNDERPADGCPPGASLVWKQVTKGTTYRFKVDGKAGATGTTAIAWKYTVASDSYGDRQLFVDGSPSTYNFNTVGAGAEADEPEVGGTAAAATTWFAYQALGTSPDATLTVDTCGSDFDTVMALYATESRTTPITSLEEGLTNDDAGGSCGFGSRIQVNTRWFPSYAIQVDGVGGGTGNLKLNWGYGPRNDLFASPTEIDGSAGSVSGTSVGTYDEPGETTPTGAPAGKSTWYSYTAPANGWVTVDTCGSTFDTVLGVYRGSSVEFLSAIASDDDGCTNGASRVDFRTSGGQTYRIQVQGTDDGSGPETGTVKLQWQFHYPAAEPFDSWSAFVNRQFTDLTGKPATAAQISNWATELDHGTKVEGDLFDGIRKGADHSASVDPTARLYRAFLGRTPDAGGLKFWVNRKRSGAWSLQRIADYFASSSEFKTKYGTLSNRQFVTRIYTDVMGRPADPSGVDFWTRQLDQGKRTRGGVMIGFSESSEYKRRQAENTDVSVAYIFLLDRAPTPDEVTDWVARQRAGTTRSELASDLLRSQEYIDHVAG